MHKSFFVDYNVTNNREERAEEAAVALNYFENHDMENGPILDIGCGNGSTTQWFSKNLNTDVVGIEVGRTLPLSSNTHNPRINLLFASGLKLPFLDKSFHTVILNDVLEHVSYEEAAELFAEINRIIDETGQLYVSVANKYEIREPHSNLPFISWLPRWIYKPVVRKIFHDDVYPYTAKRFNELAERAEFSTKNFTWMYVSKKIGKINYIGNTIVRPLVRILNKLEFTKNLGFKRFLELFAVLIFTCKKNPIIEGKVAPYHFVMPTANFQEEAELSFNPEMLPPLEIPA